MAEKKETKKPALIECQVVTAGYHVGNKELPIGTVIKLTEDQARRLVGKVKPAKDINEEAKAAALDPKGIKAIADENAALKKEIAQLKDQLAKASKK